MARARVLLFAQAAEAAGKRSAEFEAATVGELVGLAVSDFGQGFGSVVEVSAVWLNGEPASVSDVLRDGDEVAILPPVSGGA